MRFVSTVLTLAFLAVAATPALPCVCDDHAATVATAEAHACCAAREQALEEADGPAVEHQAHGCCHGRVELAEAVTTERVTWQAPATSLLAVLPAAFDRSWRRAPAVMGGPGDRAPPAPLAERLAHIGVYRC